MERIKRIGITGGIGSGKTTVCKVFEMLGIKIFYADDVAKDILASDSVVVRKVKKLLGASSYLTEGKPNKPYIASKIFSDPNLREKLNQIIHPVVHTYADQWYNDVINQGYDHKYVLQEAALLVENESYKKLDGLIVVTCPEEIRIKRVIDRDHITVDRVKDRINSQLAESIKVSVADFVIVNDNDHLILPQIIRLHKELSSK